MTERLNANGMTLAPGVVDTIIAIAVNDVEGVASVGSHATSGLRQMFASKLSSAGIETQLDEDGKLHVTLHIEVKYGSVLPEVANNIRQSVADALMVQVGVDVAAVDIYVDGIQFGAQNK